MQMIKNAFASVVGNPLCESNPLHCDQISHLVESTAIEVTGKDPNVDWVQTVREFVSELTVDVTVYMANYMTESAVCLPIFLSCECAKILQPGVYCSHFPLSGCANRSVMSVTLDSAWARMTSRVIKMFY